jgi:transposase InsO family protein
MGQRVFEAAVACFAKMGIRIERVMADNGSYRSKAFRAACKRLGLRQTFTRPFRTNGKAERFIQTSLPRMDLRSRLQHLR